MKRVAVVLTASLALALAACTVEKPVEVSAPRAEVKDVEVSSDDGAGSDQHKGSADRLGVSPGPVALSVATQDERSAVEAVPGEEVRPATPANGVRDESVRDAKEAAEEAARKIVDVTVGAANKIKEVSLGAVQAVRDTANRSNDESAAEELAANDERAD